MSKILNLKTDKEKIRRYLARLKNLCILMILLTLFSFCFIFIPKKITFFLILIVFFSLILFWLDKISFSRFFKKVSNLKKLESEIDEELDIHIFLFITLLIFMSLALVRVPFIIIIIVPVSSLILKLFFFLDFFPLSHFNLKNKVELSAYISFIEYFIIFSFISFLEFLNRSWQDLTLYLSIQSIEHLNIVKILLMGAVILLMTIINIQINNWRINKRFKHIVSLKTKDLKNEKSEIIKTIKGISGFALKKKDNEEQWRRNGILKTRLSCIESEINKISNEYTSKPDYLSKIPILIGVIYILFDILMKFLEILSLQ